MSKCIDGLGAMPKTKYDNNKSIYDSRMILIYGIIRPLDAVDDEFLGSKCHPNISPMVSVKYNEEVGRYLVVRHEVILLF